MWFFVFEPWCETEEWTCLYAEEKEGNIHKIKDIYLFILRYYYSK